MQAEYQHLTISKINVLCDASSDNHPLYLYLSSFSYSPPLSLSLFNPSISPFFCLPLYAYQSHQFWINIVDIIGTRDNKEVTTENYDTSKSTTILAIVGTGCENMPKGKFFGMVKIQEFFENIFFLLF